MGGIKWGHTCEVGRNENWGKSRSTCGSGDFSVRAVEPNTAGLTGDNRVTLKRGSCRLTLSN